MALVTNQVISLAQSLLPSTQRDNLAANLKNWIG